jgi:hypothetical protein
MGWYTALSMKHRLETEMPTTIDDLLLIPDLYEKVLRENPRPAYKNLEDVITGLKCTRQRDWSEDIHAACERVIQAAVDLGDDKAAWEEADPRIDAELTSFRISVLGCVVWTAAALSRASSAGTT